MRRVPKLPLRHARCLIAACLLVGLLPAIAPRDHARAEPLPREACDLLGDEHKRLVGSGVREWMAGGAAAARSRLTGEQLKVIERLIEVDEQLSFRCGLFKARYVLARDPEEPEPEPAKAKEGGKAPVKSKSKAKAEAAEGSGAAEGRPAASAARPTPRRKPKADDAHRPAEAAAQN